MAYYKSILNIQHHRDLCHQKTVTQNNFYNVVHIDSAAKKDKVNEKKLQWINSPENNKHGILSYIQTILPYSHGI